MRLFIAIQLNDEMKERVRETQDAFRRQGVRGNYTPPENLHLTLAFIGEYGDLDGVLDAMETVRFFPFSLTMEKTGCFGDLWWTGFADSKALDNLVKNLRHALADAGIPYDKKKFKAHCTILRKAVYAKGSEPPQVRIAPVRMCAERISLMRSTRGRHGMIYTELGSVPAQADERKRK
jgi:2'-5' RNA ligase